MNNSLSNLRWVTRIENRRNRPDIISDIEAWKLVRKVYYQDWHKKMYPIKQQILGITPRSEMTKSKQPNYERDLMRKYRATFSEEKKESIKIKQRDSYHNSGGKERQQKHLQNEEVHNKRMEQQRLKRANLTQEQKDAAAKRRKEIYDAKKKLI